MITPNELSPAERLNLDLTAPETAKMLRDVSEQIGGYPADVRELKIADGLSSSADVVAYIDAVSGQDPLQIGKEIIGYYLDASANAKGLSSASEKLLSFDAAPYNQRAVATTRRYEDTARLMVTADIMDYSLDTDYSDADMNQRYLGLLKAMERNDQAMHFDSIAEDEQKRAAFWSLQITGFDDGEVRRSGLIDIDSTDLQDFIAKTFGGNNG